MAHGTYHEHVVIDKSLSLIGEGSENTVIDATGLPNGIHVDGHHHPGLAHVSVTGFTVANANFEGILVTDSSYITVANNHVTGSDKSLTLVKGQPPTCPGLPSYFVDFQGFDCGEGIHLSGVDHSTVANNLVERNARGHPVKRRHRLDPRQPDLSEHRPEQPIRLRHHSGLPHCELWAAPTASRHLPQHDCGEYILRQRPRLR
ncbi:MAG: right-handed parallel beta-helix repeat-containing protein [Bryobacterales bacterium]|nr:right-handed parallel beta-helix repeat-containing protein [Bryobacterales bacterium]